MFCVKCGEKLKASDRFCSNCGEPMGKTTDGESSVVLEPPKDMVWNIDGFPGSSKKIKTQCCSNSNFVWGAYYRNMGVGFT